VASPDRFRELASRSAIAAMVVGRADAVRLIYLHQTHASATPELDAAIREGFSFVGVVGINRASDIISECEPGFERLMEMERIDFGRALFAMRADLPAA
jgi:hypothetical protein